MRRRSARRVRSARAYSQVRERLGLVTATLAEDIAGMRVVQAFTREQRNQQRFEEVNSHYREANQQTVVLNGLYFPFVDFLSAAATAIVLGFGGNDDLSDVGEPTVGNYDVWAYDAKGAPGNIPDAEQIKIEG